MIDISSLGELDMEKNVVLITGAAGFIGGALILNLVENTDYQIIGIDNLNNYYDVALKNYRLERIRKNDESKMFTFIKADVSDKKRMNDIFDEFNPDIVVHLAAQAGVRYSIENPDVYIQSNIIGFYNILEACRSSKDKENNHLKHLIYASSSSVYGNNEKIPYSEEDSTDHPVSLYAATKKADEAMAYSYSKLYGIPMTGLRFFTVYGPAGRPDMAYYKFTEKLLRGEKIELYNRGNNKRDFTYIDDVVEGIVRILNREVPESYYKIYNIGNNTPVDTETFVHILFCQLKNSGILEVDEPENFIVRTGEEKGDVNTTYADVERLYKDFGIKPKVSLEVGLNRFAVWFVSYKFSTE